MNGAGRFMVTEYAFRAEWLVVDTETETPRVHSRHDDRGWAEREAADMQGRHDAEMDAS